LVLAFVLALSAWKPAGKLIQGGIILLILVALVTHTAQMQEAWNTLRKSAGL
jgi:hypothetical protein